MTDLPEYKYIPGKDELKTQLPLSYACARLGIILNSEGSGICPFHSDQRPSFSIYRTQEGEERWHCFPCNLDGDIFNLIQLLHNVDFPEAMREAADLLEELPEGYTPVYAKAPKETNPEELHRLVNDARARAAREDHAGILSARVGFAEIANPALCARWDTYLRDMWGWGITENGEILMPHWSEAPSELVGCKIRKASGGKESVPGSVYSGQLYGAWLGRRNQDAVIFEGETDTVYGGWLAREEQIPIDVFGLPSGANDDVSPEWLTFLKKSRTVYLAFDPDAVGIEATWKWIEKLTGEAINIKICCLPLGRDFRDAKPTLGHLLEAARAPIQQPVGIAIANAYGKEARVKDCVGYFRPGKDDEPRQVTNWFVEPIAQLVGGDPGYDVNLVHRGVVTRTVLRLSDLTSSREIKKWCNRHNLIFTAREDDLQRIAEHVTWRGSVTPEIYQTDQIGMQPAPGNYEFAGPSVVFPEDYIGKMPWRYIPGPRVTDVTGKVFLPNKETFRWSWLDDFLKLSVTSVTHPLLAWIVASARRPEVDNFPVLFIGGSSGVGKSTLARLALRLSGSGIETDLGSVTPFILLKTLSSSTSLPVFVDEWTLMSRKDTREMFQGLIPVIYAGRSAERGQSDLSSTLYPMTAPVIVAGEDSFALDRELDRTVCISPSRSGQNKEALARIITSPLEAFGQQLHRWVTSRKDLPPLSDGEAGSRPDYNRQILIGGWRTLQYFLQDASHSDPTVSTIPDVPDLSLFDEEREDSNVYETALLEGLSMRDPSGHQVVWIDPERPGVWVRVRILIGLLKTRNVDLQLPGGERAMKRYFEERYGTISSSRVIPPGSMSAVHAAFIPNLSLGDEELDPRASWLPA